MTDQPLLPPPEEPSEPEVVATKPPRRDIVPWLYGVGFIILATAVYYVWQYPSTSGEVASVSPALQTIDQHLAEIDTRLVRLEQRPTPDISKISSRIDVLEGRMTDQTQLASRLDAISGRIESLAGRDQSGIDAVKQSLDALTGRIAVAESKAASVDAMAKRLSRIARLQEASLALASGHPVGDLPNAPEAIARYAHTAPPTEEQLRHSFQQYEKAALSAKQPDEADAPFVGRIWERAQGLITIRRGDEVVVGNQSSVALNQAQAALDAGDLQGAVTAVEALKGQPGQIMAGWVAEAKALLSARSALTAMVDQV